MKTLLSIALTLALTHMAVAQSTLTVDKATGVIKGPVTAATFKSANTIGSVGGGDALVANPLSQFSATTSAQLRGVLTDEAGTGVFYTVGGALGTPASGTLTNATGLPITTGVGGMAAGAATFLGVATSANLRDLLTDEVGTGAFYTVGGALGTPASATLTNATGLPITTGVSGLGADWGVVLSSPNNQAPKLHNPRRQHSQ